MRLRSQVRGRSARRAAVGVVAVTALTVGMPALGGTVVAVAGAAARPAASSAARVASDTPTLVARAPQVPAGAARIGAVPAGRTVSGVIGLVPAHAAALDHFASAISTPGSTAYHRYLAAGTFSRYFAPSPATVSAVESDLGADGLRVSSVSANHLLVGFHGTASTVARAFHTTLATYRLAGGRTAFANTSALMLPAGIAPSVQAVVGLDDLVSPTATPFQPADKPRGTAAQRSAALHAAEAATTTASGPVACRTALADAGEEDGLTDTEIADAYGVDGLSKAGATGRGQTVAVYELEPYRATDIKAFDNCYFGAKAADSMQSRLTTVAVDGGDPTGPGSAEAELDIDDISALAPGANIDVYEAPPSDAGYLDDWNAIVDDDTARTVSSSWGSGCETEVATEEPGLEQVENTIFEQAAVQGQTVLDAAGDSGADGCAADSAVPVSPDLSVDDPASQPYVTAVGGTTVDEASDPPVEQVWNDGSDAGAGGGGISAVWPDPAWQARSGVPGVDSGKVVDEAEKVAGSDFCDDGSVTGPCREIPDVSANADEYTGITIDYDGEWGTIGGTSSSTPLWAAMLADADSTKACGSAGVGFVSPALYAIASVPAEYKASFNDVTAGDNDNFGATDGLYQAGRGYDMATGLGSPRLTGPGDAKGLAYYLCTPAAAAPPVVSAISPQVISGAEGTGTGAAGGPVTLTITGSGFESAGAPDVAGITVGSHQVAPFTVVDASTITVTLPAAVTEEGKGGTGAGSGRYDVSVTLIGGKTSRPSAAATLTVYDDPSGSGAATPVVDAVTPSGGNEAGGTVIHVYGTGLTSAGTTSTVTIGGVAAHVTSSSTTELTAVVPPYSAGGAGATACATAENARTNVCQTQVQVDNGNAASAPSTILPEYSSASTAPADATEDTAAPTEFDYLPTPTVTSVRYADPSAQRYASEEGFSYATGAGNEVTVHGTGLGELGLEWFDVGTPGREATQDGEILGVTATSVQLFLPSTGLTHVQLVKKLAAQTLASPNQSNLTGATEPSDTVPVVYAPVPKLTSFDTASGYPVGPTAGGTRISAVGRGFDDHPFVLFSSEDAFSQSTEYDLDRSSSSRLSFVTTSQLPGPALLAVCTVSGCSGDHEVCIPGECLVTSGGSEADIFTFYAPGRPSVKSSSPRKGRRGTIVTVDGTNLAFPQAVYIGTRKLPTGDFGNEYNGDFTPNLDKVGMIVPGGLPLGRKLDIRIVTAESETTGQPKTAVNPAVTFTETKGSAGGFPPPTRE